MVNIMTKRTKKVGIAGRLGARYGIRIRRRIQEVDAIKSAKHKCPKCLQVSVKRVASGIWRCRHCDFVFAGGAYTPFVTKGIVSVEVTEEKEEGGVDVQVQ